MNKEEKQRAINLARFQAAAEYAARLPQPLNGARQNERVQSISDSYRQAVEEFRLWSESITAREEDFKNGRTPRDRHEPRTT